MSTTTKGIAKISVSFLEASPAIKRSMLRIVNIYYSLSIINNSSFISADFLGFISIYDS